MGARTANTNVPSAAPWTMWKAERPAKTGRSDPGAATSSGRVPRPRSHAVSGPAASAERAVMATTLPTNA